MHQPKPPRTGPALVAAGATAVAAVVLAAVAVSDPRPTDRTVAAAPAARLALSIRVHLPLLMKAVAVSDLPPAPTAVPPTATASAPPSPTAEPTRAVSPTTAASATPTTEPPTATPTDTAEPAPPTETPTDEPTAEPTPTLKPPVAAMCSELAVNGDFERGATGWDLFTNAGARYDRLTRVIRQPATNERVQPHGGTWVGQLGGGTGSWTDEITNPDPASARGYLLPPATEMVSATLRFHFALDTQEARDRIPNDRFHVTLMNEDASDQIQVLDTPISEETQLPGEWKAYTFDVTQAMTARRRWDRARLKFKSENGLELATWHTLDDVSLQLCVKREGAGRFDLPLRGWRTHPGRAR